MGALTEFWWVIAVVLVVLLLWCAWRSLQPSSSVSPDEWNDARSAEDRQ